MLDKNNEVFFGEYCRTCKYKNYSETDSPCAECIAEPVNLYSHKPVKWEGADGIFSGPPPRPDHAYERAVKYIPEKRKDKEKAFARQNIDAEYAGNKVQSLDGEVTEDQYPSATAVQKALEETNEATTQALASKIDSPSGCKCDDLLAVGETDEDGNVVKAKAVPAPQKLSDFENDLYYRKIIPELTITLTKDDFTLDEANEAYVYRKDGKIDRDIFTTALISINGMLDQIENPEFNLNNEDFGLDHQDSYQVFYSISTKFLFYISNGCSVTDTDNPGDFVEVLIPQLQFEMLDSLTVAIGFIDQKIIPEWAVDFSSSYDYIYEIYDELSFDIGNIHSEVTNLQNNIRMAIVTTTGTSSAYKVTTPDDIGTKKGDLLVVIPHVTSTTNFVTLTVNNGDKKYIYAYHMGLNAGNSRIGPKNWFGKDQPYILLREADNFLVVASPSFGFTGVVNFGYCSFSGDVTDKIATLNRTYIGDNESGGVFGIVFSDDNTAANPRLRIIGNGTNFWYGDYCDIVTVDGAPILPTMIKAGKLYLFAFAGRSFEIASTTTTGLEKKYILLNPDSETEQESLPSPATAQVGQIVKVKAVDADGKITETETVDMPKAEEWEVIKTIDIAEGADETTTLTINTDNDGNTFSLKKARLFARFPIYTGETTIPNFSFSVLNGYSTGDKSPFTYTSVFPKLSTSGTIGTVWEVDVSGLMQYEKVVKSSNATWPNNAYGTTNSNHSEIWGEKRVQTITSIGGTAMIIYPGCHFELHGVRA